MLQNQRFCGETELFRLTFFIIMADKENFMLLLVIDLIKLLCYYICMYIMLPIFSKKGVKTNEKTIIPFNAYHARGGN